MVSVGAAVAVSVAAAVVAAAAEAEAESESAAATMAPNWSSKVRSGTRTFVPPGSTFRELSCFEGFSANFREGKVRL